MERFINPLPRREYAARTLLARRSLATDPSFLDEEAAVGQHERASEGGGVMTVRHELKPRGGGMANIVIIEQLAEAARAEAQS